MDTTASTPTCTRIPIALTVVALLATLLGMYQWFELVQLRNTGKALACTLSAQLDCAAVWNSPLSQQVHQITGIPIVGWGLAWSLVVLCLSVVWLYQAKKQTADPGTVAWALRLTTGVGALIALALLAYSASIKIFCPTCIAFYVLVALAVYLAFRHRSAMSKSWIQPALMSGGLLLVVLAPLLYLGLHTPRENVLTANVSSVSDVPVIKTAVAAGSPLEKFLNSLPPRLQQAVSDSLLAYRNATPIDKPLDPRRLTYGSANAPVHLIEWTDIRCPHCKRMEEALNEIRGQSPDAWSEETRHYPLDSECNPHMERSAGGVSCLAAKLQICLIGSPDFARVRATMFAQQEGLTKEGIWEIATKDSERRKALEGCVDSPKTATSLQDDITYAEQHGITGTPLVAINGRKAPALPAFIFALIMTQGRDNDPGFAVLPKAEPNPDL